MENTSRDILFQIGVELDLPDLLRLCQSNKQINAKLCQQDAIWYYKLENDFNEYLNFETRYSKFKPVYQRNKREYYVFLYKLNKIKTAWNLKYNLYELYYLSKLNLDRNKIESIPKEIGQLYNLQRLYLKNNKIHNIPKDIGDLHNLQVLDLSRNNIKEVPK